MNSQIQWHISSALFLRVDERVECHCALYLAKDGEMDEGQRAPPNETLEAQIVMDRHVRIEIGEECARCRPDRRKKRERDEEKEELMRVRGSPACIGV